jgi:uncharacterized repeat protein (TIGR01451 family)
MSTALVSRIRTPRRAASTPATPSAWAALPLLVLVAACSDAPTRSLAPTASRLAAGGGGNGTIITPGTEETEPVVQISATSLAFAAQPLGTRSAPASLRIANTGTADLVIDAFDVTGPNAGDFRVSNDGPVPCPIGGALAPSTSCEILVTFTPSDIGTRTAELNVRSNARTTASTTLTGNGYVSADIGLSMTGQLAANRDITYDVTLSDAGPNTATGVTFVDVLPAGTAFVSLTAPPDLSCTTPAVGGTGNVGCTAASVAVGNPRTLKLVVRALPTAGRTVTNTATVSANYTDPNPSNNTVNWVTELSRR